MEPSMEELKAKAEKAHEIKKSLSAYFEKEDLEIGVVVGILMTMLVEVLEATDTPPHHAILMFGTLVAQRHDDKDESDDEGEDEPDEKGVMQWLN